MSAPAQTSTFSQRRRLGPRFTFVVTDEATTTRPVNMQRQDAAKINKQYDNKDENKRSILRLPNEILLSIGEFMDESSLAATVQTSRFMRDLLTCTLYTKAHNFAPEGYPSVANWAAEKGRVATLDKVFRQMPMDANWPRAITEGVYAAINGDQVCTLQFLGSRFRGAVKFLLSGNTPNSVKYAAKANSVDVLRYLLESGVTFTTPPLQSAVTMFEGHGSSTGDTRVAELLMQHGFDVRVKDEGDRNLLHEMATRGSTAHINLVAAAAPECLNRQDDHGRTPLMHAIAAGQHRCAKYMLTVARADVNPRNNAGDTALHLAVDGGYVELAEELIQHGADINAPDDNQRTPLHVATDTTFGSIRDPRMVATLLTSGAFCSPVDKFNNTPLKNALAARDARTVNWLMTGAVHHEYEFEGTGVLLDGCRVGSIEIVRYYMGKGIDIEGCEDRWKRSALHLAASGAHAEVVGLLLRNWREVERRDEAGRTALWYAARKIDHACVHLLIEAGASVDQGDSFGITPLMNLTHHAPSPEAMSHFLGLSTNIEWTDIKKGTVLHHAARNGNLHATRAVADFRPGLLEQQDGEQQSALMIAITHRQMEVIQFLRTVILLTPEEFKWLQDHGYKQAVKWIGSGPEWEPTRRVWSGRLELEAKKGKS